MEKVSSVFFLIDPSANLVKIWTHNFEGVSQAVRNVNEIIAPALVQQVINFILCIEFELKPDF